MGRWIGPGSIGDDIRDVDRRLRLLERGHFRAPAVTADPVPVRAGDIWIRKDTGQLCWHDGTQIRRITGT